MDIIQKDKKKMSEIKEIWLTTEEAVVLANVSKHTIRSWSQKNIIINKKEKGRYGLETRISKRSLIDHLNSSGIKTDSKVEKPEIKKDTSKIENKSSLSPDLSKYIEVLENTLKNTQKQLEEKDLQIKSLMEKLTQANTLTLNAQNLALNTQEEKKQLKLEIEKINTPKNRKKILGIF